jgi:glycosyltransferase involved in cell wall biosynthesis
MNIARQSIKKRILCIADLPNWIFNRHIFYLQRYLGDEFEIFTSYRRERYEESDFDLIYPLEHMLVEPDQITNPNKYVTGIRSFISWAVMDFKPFIDYLNTKFQCVHVVSAELYNLFSPYLPGVEYLTHGVDTAFFSPSQPTDSRPGALRLGWAGRRDTFIKGFQDYIYPLSQLPGVELKICGYLDQNLSLDDMPGFYDSIDAYICASSFEGNNNSLLEAASMERAIITTQVGTVPEYLRDRESALIVERDLEQITQSVIELRDNPELRSRLGKNARQSLIEKKWDWKYKAEDFRRFFHHALVRSELGRDQVLIPNQAKRNNDPHLMHVLQAQNQLLREMLIGDAIQLFDLKEEKRILETEKNALENAIQEIRVSETYRLMQKILSNRLSQDFIKTFRKFRD